MKKLLNYFFNKNKTQTKLQTFMNWMWILLPFMIITIMMIYQANTKGLTLLQKQNSTTASVVGLFVIVWFGLVIWFTAYKIRMLVKRHTKPKVKQASIKKEDWHE